MKIVDKIKVILFRPTSFFTSLKKEKGVKEAFKYFAIVSLFSAVMTVIVNLLLKDVITTTVGKVPTPGEIFFFYLLGLPLYFLGAGLFHIWIMIFGGRALYSKTYQLSVYTSTPYWLFGWFPLLGFIVAAIWDIVLTVIGVQHTHGLSKTRALWMVLLPLVLFMLLIIFVVGLAAFFYNYSTLPLPA
jgi:hypothetical protein